MELNIIENTKYKIVAELKGEDHTFCNLLVKELQNNENVKSAAYAIAHPLHRVPKITVETNTNITAKQALLDAVASLKKTVENFHNSFEKEV
ncbi:MAG: DNA-directed RNA polymerase subunit L [Nanoarchaeota archaeon]|nr:DNA-directed RNA polymerase subunit L [Nanoarchaeota archaeon]